jgi:hypothetical protein
LGPRWAIHTMERLLQRRPTRDDRAVVRLRLCVRAVSFPSPDTPVVQRVVQGSGMAALASDRDGVAADPARPACIRTLLEKASALRRGVTPDAAAVSNVWRQRTAVVQAAMDPEVAGSSAAPARRPRPASAAPARRVGGVAGSASAPLVACCEPARITDSPGSPTRRAAETTLHRQFLARVSQLHADAFASAAADVGFGALSGGAPTLTDTLASRMSSSAGRTRPMSATMYSSSRASLHGTSAPARQPFRAVPRGRSQFVDADAQYDAVTCTDGAEAVEPPPGGFTLVCVCLLASLHPSIPPFPRPSLRCARLLFVRCRCSTSTAACSRPQSS